MKGKITIIFSLFATVALLSWLAVQTDVETGHVIDPGSHSLPARVLEEEAIPNVSAEVRRSIGTTEPISILAESGQVQDTTAYADIIRKIDYQPDPFALARERYEEQWSHVAAEMGMSTSDRLRFEQTWIGHKAYNSDLTHQMLMGTISGTEWNLLARTDSELEESLEQFLSVEQMEIYRNHSQYLLDVHDAELFAIQENLIANQNTDILHASKIDDLPTVLAYIASGADPNSMPLDGSTTPLHNASRNGNLEMVQALINAGANVNSMTSDPNRYSYSPLHEAALSGNVEVIRALVAAGADINYYPPESLHRTALRQAAFMGQTDAVAELLSLGADATGDIGRYALRDARNAENLALEQMLIDAGAR